MDIIKSNEFNFLYLINKCILLFKYISNENQKNILIDIKIFIHKLEEKFSKVNFSNNILKKNKILEVLIEYFKIIIEKKIYKLINNDNIINIIDNVNNKAFEICNNKINISNLEIEKIDLEKVNEKTKEEIITLDKKNFSNFYLLESVSTKNCINPIINNNLENNEEYNSKKENNFNIENIVDNKIKKFINEIENNIRNSLKDYINHTEYVEYDLDKKFNTRIEKNNIFIENKMREIMKELVNNNKIITFINTSLKEQINEIYKYVDNSKIDKSENNTEKIQNIINNNINKLKNNIDKIENNIDKIENKICNKIDTNEKNTIYSINKYKDEIKNNLNIELDNKIKILSNIFNENIQLIFQNLNTKIINNEKDLYKIIDEKIYEYENKIKTNNFKLFFDKENNEIKLLYLDDLITSTKINIKGLIGPKGPPGNQGDKGDTPIFRNIMFTENNKLKFIIQDTKNIYEIISEGTFPLGPQGIKGERGDPGKTYLDLKWDQDNVMRIDQDNKDSLIFTKSLCIGENSHCLKNNSLSLGGGICYQNNSIAIGNNSKTLDNESIAIFGSCIGKKSFAYRAENIDENIIQFGKKDKNNYNVNSFNISSKEINFDCDTFNIKTNNYDNNKLSEFENRIALIEKKIVDIYKKI